MSIRTSQSNNIILKTDKYTKNTQVQHKVTGTGSSYLNNCEDYGSGHVHYKDSVPNQEASTVNRNPNKLMTIHQAAPFSPKQIDKVLSDFSSYSIADESSSMHRLQSKDRTLAEQNVCSSLHSSPRYDRTVSYRAFEDKRVDDLVSRDDGKFSRNQSKNTTNGFVHHSSTYSSPKLHHDYLKHSGPQANGNAIAQPLFQFDYSMGSSTAYTCKRSPRVNHNKVDRTYKSLQRDSVVSKYRNIEELSHQTGNKTSSPRVFETNDNNFFQSPNNNTSYQSSPRYVRTSNYRTVASIEKELSIRQSSVSSHNIVNDNKSSGSHQSNLNTNVKETIFQAVAPLISIQKNVDLKFQDWLAQKKVSDDQLFPYTASTVFQQTSSPKVSHRTPQRPKQKHYFKKTMQLPAHKVSMKGFIETLFPRAECFLAYSVPVLFSFHTCLPLLVSL